MPKKKKKFSKKELADIKKKQEIIKRIGVYLWLFNIAIFIIFSILLYNALYG